MSKTKALGLSNLVVTSFDKSSEEELESAGWQVPKSLPAFSLLQADKPPHARRLLELQSQLRSSLVLHHTATGADSPPVLTPQLRDYGPLPVKKEAKLASMLSFHPFSKRRTQVKRYFVMERFTIKLSRQDEKNSSSSTSSTSSGSFKAYKTLSVHEVAQIHVDSGALMCMLETNPSFASASASSSAASDEADRTWKLFFNTDAELNDFASQLALRMLLFFLIHQVGASNNNNATPTPPPPPNLAQLVSLAQPHLEMQVYANTPLVLLSLKHTDVACEVLRKRVNASCLLRPSVLQQHAVQQVLERANRDLNIVGDDAEFGLTLLHFYILTKRPQEISSLLLKIDLPFAHQKTKTGETPFTLAIKTCAVAGEGGVDSNNANLAVLGQMVNILLLAGISPDDRCGASGDSAYHLALKLPPAQFDPVCVALEQYCDINLRDARGDTPLHIALRSKNLRAAKRMLTDLRLDWELQDSQGNNALLLAMKLNEESFAIQLLSRKQPPQRMSKSLPAPLNTSSSSSSSGKQMLSSRSSDLAGAAATPASLLLPIHLAIKLHQPSLCLLLVDMLTCEEIAVKDGTGRTCLQLAILHSLLGVTFAIINKLAAHAPHLLQVHDEQTGDDALLLAVRAGRIDVAGALLCNDHFKRNLFTGQTVLHAAARLAERTYHHATQSFQSIALFKRILAKELAEDVNACTSTGRRESVLHWTVRCEDEACGLWLMDPLLQHPKLSVEVLDSEGWTALALAVQLGKWKLAQLLVPRTKLSRALGGMCETYLHLLVRAMSSDADLGAVPVMAMLLAHGMYAGEWDSQGYTALHVACVGESSLALETLLRNADVCRQRLNDRTEHAGLTPLLLLLQPNANNANVNNATTRVDMVDRIDMLLENGADFRLLEPGSRLGVFQRCEQLASNNQELFATLTRRIARDEPLCELECAARAEMELAKQQQHDQSVLVNSPEGQLLLQQRALEIHRENPLCPMEAALEIAHTTLFAIREPERNGISQADYEKA